MFHYQVVCRSLLPSNAAGNSPAPFPKNFYGEYAIRYLGNLTMLQQWLGIPHLDGPSWTLTVEFLFYAYIFILFKFGLLRHIEIVGTASLAFTLYYQLLLRHQYPDVYPFLGVNILIPGFTKSLHLSDGLNSTLSVMIVISLASLISFKLEIPARLKLKGYL